MATATATLTAYPHPNGFDNTMRSQIVKGLCALLAAGTYVTNGIPLVWGQLIGVDMIVPLPNWAEFQSTVGVNATPASQTYAWDQTHNTLRIFVAGVEVTNGTTIAVDTITFRAEFARGY